uniref:Uncharacterized protein n=1 Tax=Magnetococcus massalia (strain MO-1) TaxID=451514 RepID=A0A1S7LPM6_MAGMO|nr:Conserved membrane protein of unknown function [Candidatus Magnetococcus massalia]
MDAKVLMVFGTVVILHVHLVFTMAMRKVESYRGRFVLAGAASLWYGLAFTGLSHLTGVTLLLWCILGGIIASFLATFTKK